MDHAATEPPVVAVAFAVAGARVAASIIQVRRRVTTTIALSVCVILPVVVSVPICISVV